jgi:hypothetical protein
MNLLLGYAAGTVGTFGVSLVVCHKQHEFPRDKAMAAKKASDLAGACLLWPVIVPFVVMMGTFDLIGRGSVGLCPYFRK